MKCKKVLLDPATRNRVEQEIKKLVLTPGVHVVKGELHMKKEQDPMISAMKKAYRESAQYRLDQLLERRQRWQRKLSKASDAIASIDKELRKYLAELVAEKDGRKPE